MEIYLSLLIAIIGVLMYGFCTNPKLAEIGKICIFCGLLAFLLGANGHLFGVIARSFGVAHRQFPVIIYLTYLT